MKVLAFAGSNSRNSINLSLVKYTVSQFLSDKNVEILDINDYEMPIYGMDREESEGVPRSAFQLAQKIDNSDLLIMSLAEHNGAYSAAFKNIFDWLSRVPDRTTWGDKPIFLMASSPGPRGGASVLEIAEKRFPFNGGKIIGTFSFPSFQHNFNSEEGIVNVELRNQLENKISEMKLNGFVS